jgi:hypothetical protein
MVFSMASVNSTSHLVITMLASSKRGCVMGRELLSLQTVMSMRVNGR